jgi:hypothetical protein
MPFSKADTWRVVTALRLSSLAEKEIQAHLDSVQQQSEELVQRVLRLLDQIEEAQEIRHIASTEDAGILEVQGGKAGIKYDSHRSCSIKNYLDELREDLAKLIGYQIQIMTFPF